MANKRLRELPRAFGAVSVSRQSFSYSYAGNELAGDKLRHPSHDEDCDGADQT